jgi:hypothetical protein
MWDAMAWVADLLGCDRNDLTRLSDDEKGRVGYADANGKEVARVLVSGPMRPLDGKPGGHWIVTAELSDGTIRQIETLPDTTEISL